MGAFIKYTATFKVRYRYVGGCLSTGPIMAVINCTHAPYSSLNGNFRGDEEKKTKGLTIYPGDLYSHEALRNKLWPRASVQSRCNWLLSIIGTTVVVLTCVGFFWIPTLAKVPFGELSMRVGGLWNWHDEQFCLDANQVASHIFF